MDKINLLISIDINYNLREYISNEYCNELFNSCDYDKCNVLIVPYSLQNTINQSQNYRLCFYKNKTELFELINDLDSDQNKHYFNKVFLILKINLNNFDLVDKLENNNKINFVIIIKNLKEIQNQSQLMNTCQLNRLKNQSVQPSQFQLGKLDQSRLNQFQLNQPQVNQSQVNQSQVNQSQVNQPRQLQPNQFSQSQVNQSQLSQSQLNQSQVSQSQLNQSQLSQSNQSQLNKIEKFNYKSFEIFANNSQSLLRIKLKKNYYKYVRKLNNSNVDVYFFHKIKNSL